MFSVVNVVVIVAVISEIIAKPTIIQLTANKRPNTNFGLLSPYLLQDKKENTRKWENTLVL